MPPVLLFAVFDYTVSEGKHVSLPISDYHIGPRSD